MQYITTHAAITIAYHDDADIGDWDRSDLAEVVAELVEDTMANTVLEWSGRVGARIIGVEEHKCEASK